MRTTIRFDDDLVREAKKLAADSGKTLSQVVEDALRETLARRRMSAGRGRVELPTFGGGGLLPGVNLDDSAGLLELMEAPDP